MRFWYTYMSMQLAWTPQLTQTLFSIALTLLITVTVDLILRSLIRVPRHFDTRRARTYATIFRNIVTIIVYGIAFYIILVELHINITPLLASAGILGLAIGLGAKALIEDLIAGLFLLSQDSIAMGDFVKLDVDEGWIEKIGFRTLTIRSADGALHIIPNGQIKKVINFSRHKTRLPIDIPLLPEQPIETILKAGNEALTQLNKEKDLSDILLPGSTIDGIEEFRIDGRMVIRATLIMRYEHGTIISRRFRYLIKKTFEKHKVRFV